MIATLDRTLNRVAPKVAESFYALHSGFNDPVGVGRRLILGPVVETCADDLRASHAGIDIDEFVEDLLNNVPLVPPAIDADYRPFRDATPFPPHLICYALAYIKEHPDPHFLRPFIALVIRTGWWAGDENCIDDLLDILPDKAGACRLAADSLPLPTSTHAVFAAGQLLYHLRYGEDWGLRGYVKEQYEKALRTLKNPEDVREVRERLKSGLKPWTTLRNETSSG